MWTMPLLSSKQKWWEQGSEGGKITTGCDGCCSSTWDQTESIALCHCRISGVLVIVPKVRTLHLRRKQCLPWGTYNLQRLSKVLGKEQSYKPKLLGVMIGVSRADSKPGEEFSYQHSFLVLPLHAQWGQSQVYIRASKHGPYHVQELGAECERNRQNAVVQDGSRAVCAAGFHAGLWALTGIK